MKNRRRIGLILLFALASASALAGPGNRLYQLTGKIVQSDGKAFRNVTPLVFLFSATTPFATRTLADRGGEFKFKSLIPGMYTLVVAVPRAGEMTRTLEVGPSFADSKGRVTTNVEFDRTMVVTPDYGVSATALSVPYNARFEYRKALEYLEKRDVEGAINRLKRAIEIAPQFAAAWNYLGTIAYQTRRFEDAEKYFREALRQDPGAYAPLVNLGGALLALGRFQDSLPVNLMAVKEKPNDPLCHSQLGQSYFYLGQFDYAEVHLKQAKVLDPAHFSFPQIVLARIYRQRRNYAAVVAELEEFLKLHPESTLAPYARDELASARALVP